MSEPGSDYAFEIDAVDWHDADGVPILAAISLAAFPGASIAIVGHSGVAQTAVLRLLAGVAAPSAGAVRVAGRNLADLSYEQMRDHRRRIGYVFEGTGLLGNMTIGENIALPLAYHEEGRRSDADILDQVKRVARELAIDKHLGAPVFRVSPSVRRRALMARALALEPSLLLCDEPQAHLTRREAKLASQAFERRRVDKSMTILLTGHNDDFSPFNVQDVVHLERDPLSMLASMRPGAGPVSVRPGVGPVSIMPRSPSSQKAGATTLGGLSGSGSSGGGIGLAVLPSLSALGLAATSSMSGPVSSKRSPTIGPTLGTLADAPGKSPASAGPTWREAEGDAPASVPARPTDPSPQSPPNVASDAERDPTKGDE